MKVICDRAALLEGINIESGVVASRTPRPQLTCIKLIAEKTGDTGRLTLAATDAEMSLRLISERVDVQEPGEALLPATTIRQIISAEDAEANLSFESEGDACTIRGADAYFKVLGYDPKDFPAVPEFAEAAKNAKAVFSHPASSFRRLITKTLFATARENSRYAINGVLLKRDGKRLEFVSTDGRRLAVARANLGPDEKDGGAVTCIIPSKALSTLLKLADDPDETIRIAITDNQIYFAIGAESNDDPGRACLASNLVEGSFPPYEDVIPRDQDIIVRFDRDVMLSAVRRAALLTNEESRGVEMSFNAADKTLELSSAAPELGESKITVDLLEYKGDDISLGFNPAFISDALKVIEEPEVIIELSTPKKPGVIKAGSDFVYVVMPVNIQ
ncbi:MAG: DNA polymerase III subunit beta [Phycisphaerales bacterium]|nr:DNA polymerase III subunit beta [Phycisphaerales bacterium]